jgi:hypothetical protein
MLSESDLFYYVALAIVSFIVLYIIYISLQFQNNVIESFSVGGGGSKKDNKGKEKQSKIGKIAEEFENYITLIEDEQNISINKDAYLDLLELSKKYVDLLSVSITESIAKDVTFFSKNPQFVTAIKALKDIVNSGDIEKTINSY